VRAFLVVLLWVVLPAAASGGEEESLLTQLKVAYLYNFTRFVEWPGAPADRPFVIRVLGDPEFAEQLRVLERQRRQVGPRPIEVHAESLAEIGQPGEILFVGTGAQGRLDAIVRETAGKPVLLVADTPGSARRGIAIELFRKPDVFRKTERLRFRINPSAIERRGLVVSAQLYDVAEVTR
jgi:hypothetical protein